MEIIKDLLVGLYRNPAVTLVVLLGATVALTVGLVNWLDPGFPSLTKAKIKCHCNAAGCRN